MLSFLSNIFGGVEGECGGGWGVDGEAGGRVESVCPESCFEEE